MCFFFFKQTTAYEMRISDWSSDVCSSDLLSPKDMDLKGGQSRTIHISKSLMDRLWQYCHTYRPMLVQRNEGLDSNSLFLTVQGTPYTYTGIGKLCTLDRKSVV